MTGPKFLNYERKKIGILVVEQETQIQLLLQTALSAHGFDLTMSTNSQKGLQLLQQHKNDIAAVLIAGTALGGNGEKTLADFHAVKPGIPVLVMTGDIVANNPDQLLKHGAMHVLKKPFSIADLIQTVLQVVADADARNSEVDAKDSHSL